MLNLSIVRFQRGQGEEVWGRERGGRRVEPGTRMTIVNFVLGTSGNIPIAGGWLEYKSKSVNPPGVGSAALKMSDGQLLVVLRQDLEEACLGRSCSLI